MSDWIEWNGGECPVAAGKLVDVKFRNGVIVAHELAENWDWEHGIVQDDGDIIAYRVVTDMENVWVEWNGGKRPVAAGTIVDVKFRDGTIWKLELAENRDWEHDLARDRVNDIIAYRVVREVPKVSETHEGPFNRQIGGTHYKDMPIQPFEFSMKNGLDPMQHTIIKYVTRFRHKNGREDLEKAKHTIDLLIEHEYESDDD